MPIITSSAALRELSSGVHIDAIASSPRLHVHTTGQHIVLIAADDDADTPLVIVNADNLDDIVPAHLERHRREVLSRMASFAERIQAGQSSLPRGWHQFKKDNLVSFFASPSTDSSATRWIAERLLEPAGSVVFWRATTAKSKTELDEFQTEDLRVDAGVDEIWATALEAYDAERRQVRGNADAEVFLPHRDHAAVHDQSFSGLIESASPDQLQFIEAATDRSIRLRGPAGSGKTLALTLKAVRHALESRQKDSPARVLIVTHSWQLATQISRNIDMMGVGSLGEIDVFPLLEIADSISPRSASDSDLFRVIGDDSFSGKQAQLDEVLEILTDFRDTDWVSFRHLVSDSLKTRFDSDDSDQLLALAWDLLVEFGSVIGAAGIFPGAGSEQRYLQLSRSSWMLPLNIPGDLRVVFRVYEKYMRSLEERHLITSDQVLADFLSYLSSHAWNRNRKSLGYDLIFVDEFHLFSPLERQVLHYLTRDVSQYPRIFMAMDPRQSPSEVFIGGASDDALSGEQILGEEGLGDVTDLNLTTVHRFTPQILSLIKHIHHEFPTLALGEDWAVDFSTVNSSQGDGTIPRLIESGTISAEENDIVRTIHDVYQRGRVAIAVVDRGTWGQYSSLASRLSKSGRFHVSVVSARADIDDIGYRKKGIVVAPAEHLAGLQFSTVICAGVPSLSDGAPPHEQRRLLSLMYLAVSRAESEVHIFSNRETQGTPDVLRRAASQGLVRLEKGSLA